MKKDLKDVEDLLRDGKLPERDTAQIRHHVWQKVLQAQRKRHQPKALFIFPPWIWFMASILVIVLGIVVMFILR